MSITLIHYPLSMAESLPAPWQPRWEIGVPLPIGLDDVSRGVARAPEGTPIPEGCTAYSPPEITPEIRERGLAGLRRLAAEGANALDRQIAQLTLDNPDAAERAAGIDYDIRVCLGVAHQYAVHAPMAVARLIDACGSMIAAQSRWTSAHSCVVVRTAPFGFHVWRGIGGLMEEVGTEADYESAERRGVSAVRTARNGTIRDLQSGLLAGWDDDTPWFSSATLRTYQSLPIHVHRGPMTAAELPVPPTGSASSWDLPVVATYQFVVERHDERVTWSDDESRAAHLRRQRAGEERKAAEVQQARALLEQDPRLAPFVRLTGFGPGVVRLQSGEEVRLVGPVRMRRDGKSALFLGEVLFGVRRRRIWISPEAVA